MFGLSILNWVQIAAVLAVVSAGLWTVHDYKNKAVKIEAQANTIKKLENNIAALKKISADTKVVIQQLDEACAAQAERFLKETDLIRRLEESEDPLTDAVNSVIVPEAKGK